MNRDYRTGVRVSEQGVNNKLLNTGNIILHCEDFATKQWTILKIPLDCCCVCQRLVYSDETKKVSSTILAEVDPSPYSTDIWTASCRDISLFKRLPCSNGSCQIYLVDMYVQPLQHVPWSPCNMSLLDRFILKLSYLYLITPF